VTPPEDSVRSTPIGQGSRWSRRWGCAQGHQIRQGQPRPGSCAGRASGGATMSDAQLLKPLRNKVISRGPLCLQSVLDAAGVDRISTLSRAQLLH
jgi:hypothetical protein